MGIKRTQDSGRRDALGREIKVSGNASQRASGSGVDGGESGARSDFASQTGSESEHSLASLSGALKRIEDARNAEALRAQGVRRDIEMMEQEIEDLRAKSERLAEGAQTRQRDVLREQARSLIAEFDERGSEAIRDPQFLAAAVVVDIMNDKGEDDRLDDDRLDDDDEEDAGDVIYPIFEALQQDGGETYRRPYAGSLSLTTLNVDDETLRREAKEMDEINDLQRQVVDIASSLGDPDAVKVRLQYTDEGMRVIAGRDAGGSRYLLEAFDDGRYEILDTKRDRFDYYDSMFDALKAMRDGQ